MHEPPNRMCGTRANMDKAQLRPSCQRQHTLPHAYTLTLLTISYPRTRSREKGFLMLSDATLRSLNITKMNLTLSSSDECFKGAFSQPRTCNHACISY